MSLAGEIASMFFCACTDCQRYTGGGHACVALVRSEALAVEGARPKSFARSSESGATFTRHFCPDCGTPLYGQSSRVPELRMLPVGFFVGQNEWFDPNQMIFARSHQTWDVIADHLPRHETYRPPAQT